MPRRGSRALLGLAALAALGATLAEPPRRAAEAQSGDPLDVLVGRYRNVDADGGRATIEGAVDAVLEGANVMIRALARSRLLENNAAITRLVIERAEGGAVRVSYDGTRSYVGVPGGSPSEHRAPDGTAVRVRYAIDDGALVEVVDSGRGYAQSAYVARGGSLTLRTSIVSPHLPEPVRYQLRFRPDRGSRAH